MYGGLSEDEILARQLQEEEDRSMSRGHQRATRPGVVHNVYSAQEREDMMLARQMQEMDSFGSGGGRNNNRSAGAPIQPARRDSRDVGSSAYAGFAAASGAASPYGSSSGLPVAPHSPVGGGTEDRLAYARRLQEQAFQRVQASSQPPAPAKSTEESDLELAMKMQIEEGGGIAGPPMGQEDEDLKLAMFMEESGMSIKDFDAQGLAAAVDGSASSLPLPTPGVPMNARRAEGGSASSLGLAAAAPPINTGGVLAGLYGNSRKDSDEEDSMEFGFGESDRKMPAGVPASIPSAARSNGMPSGVPSAIPVVASVPAASMPTPSPQSAIPAVATIPPAIPPPAAASSIPMANRKKPPPGSSPLARGNEFTRSPPKPSKSIGGGLGRSGPLSRMLPSASKSFGGGRSGQSRNTPTHTQSAHNLLSLRQAANKSKGRSGRSVSPTRRTNKKNDRSAQPAGMEHLGPPLMTDLPPGVSMGGMNDPLNSAPSTPAKKKKGKIFSRMFGGGRKNARGEQPSDIMAEIPDAIPAAIPGPGAPPIGDPGPLPHSVAASRNIAQNSLRTSFNSGNPATPQQQQTPQQKQVAACSVCGGRTGKMLVAMDKKFHVDCFRCMSCNEVIDPSSVFAVSVDPMGGQQPLHRKCYAEFYGVQCAVCKRAIPANEDGSVSFIKHPFFNTEQMCPTHADEPGRRRCTGCHRFEPEDEPFADLNDGDRCVCYACCRTVVMNNVDVKPLWGEVLRFFEFQLGLPIWEEMREIPILVVGQAALNENQLKDGTSVHGDSSQIMTRGLCLSEHDGSMSFRVPSQRFNDSTASFEACNHSGFLDFDVGNLKGNSNSEVMAILCLSGLPRDLTASVLAHEATHAWIKLHPDFKVRKSLPAQVEEGCAQLVAYLFLSDGLEAPRRHSGMGPSDEKLRQYFKFSIETDDNDIYGEGYRRAALAYSTIGIAALLNHVVHYQNFPSC